MDYSYGNHNANSTSGHQNLADLDVREEKARMAMAIEEVKKEWHGYWKKEYVNAEIFPPQVAAMHPDVVDFLLSFNLVAVYDNIAREARLDAKGRNALPSIVWQIAQTKNWDSLDRLLGSELSVAPPVHRVVVQLLERNIISKLRTLSEKPFVKKTAAESETRKEIQLPLAQALQQYSNLGEQNITINPLKLRYFTNTVRPSIKNWITDFHDNMNAGKHGAIDRGNYLFHSENGKKLTPIERQKLSIVLKSLDEKTLLTIDVDTQKIIFQTNSSIDSQEKSQSVRTELPAERSISENNSEPKDIFQNNDGISSKLRNFFSSPKKENLEEVAVANDEYFQIPKVQLEAGLTPSVATVFRPEKPISANNSHSYNFKDFSSTEGKLSFSSPQKLPAEQNENIIEKEKPSISQQEPYVPPTSQINKIIQPQSPLNQQSQWTIKPTRHFHDEVNVENQSIEPRINKNIVDLRS